MRVVGARGIAEPGVAYRMLRQAPPISVWLAWWRDDPPRYLPELLDLSRAVWAG